MKYRPMRESMPLWVKLALAGIAVGTILYVSGAIVIEEMLQFGKG